MIYTDFAKAFESVSHTKLIAVLHSYGVSNDIICWLKEYQYLKNSVDYKVYVLMTCSLLFLTFPVVFHRVVC